jgi:hypothetical protein
MKARLTKMMYEAPTTTAFRFPTQSPLGDVRTAWEMSAVQDNPAATTMRRRTRAYIVSDIVLRRRGDSFNMSGGGARQERRTVIDIDPFVNTHKLEIWRFAEFCADFSYLNLKKVVYLTMDATKSTALFCSAYLAKTIPELLRDNR